MNVFFSFNAFALMDDVIILFMFLLRLLKLHTALGIKWKTHAVIISETFISFGSFH